MEPPKNIVIRLPNWLGDCVMALPVVEAVRLHWPDAKITAMCQGGVQTLLKNSPHVDEIICFSKQDMWLHKIAVKRKIIRQLRKGKYDLGILLTNSFSSAWWFWRGGVKNRIGFSGQWRSALLNTSVPFPKKRKEQHLVHTYKCLLQDLGVPLDESTSPTLYFSEEEITQAKELLKRHGYQEGDRLIGINTGAAYGPAKCWLPERFQEVAHRFLEDDQKNFVVFFGDSAGRNCVDEIMSGLSGRVCSLAGITSLRELMVLIKVCDVFLTNDSGPMHIGAAAKTPMLALFGSTDDTVTGPYRSGELIHKHVDCSPCFKRVCPIDFRCMKQISVDEVYQRMQKLLGITR